MEIDFGSIQDVESYAAIPEGTYVCRVSEVREGTARDGSPRWALRLEVADGEYTGRTAAWDGLTWSERGLKRVKHVLDKLGFDVRGRLQLQSPDLVGRVARVQLQTEEREDPLSGARQLRLRVPYLGYASLDEAKPPF